MKKLLTFFTMALLAFAVGWAAEVTDVLTSSWTGINTSSYSDFIKEAPTSDAIYAGNCAGSNSYIQLRSNNNNSGIVTTGTGGKVKSITVVWNSSTSNGRTLNVYGKNTAYSAAANLYNNSLAGTLLGTIVCGTSTSLTISGDYQYIGLRSASGAMYLTSISIVWETGGSTTVAAPTISPDGGIFATSQEVTLSHADGGTIYYTLDGNDPTTSSTQYSTPFTINSTTTVKAIAVQNGVSSSVASATFTEVGVANIAEANAYTEGSEFIFTGNAVVTYHKEKNGNHYIWLRDLGATSGGGVLYNPDNNVTTQGAVLTPGWHAKRTLYNTWSRYTEATGISQNEDYQTQTVDPFDRTDVSLTDAHMNEFIVLNGVTLTGSGNNWTATSGSRTTHTLYNQFGVTGLTDGKKYNIKGAVSKYNGNIQVYILEAEEVVTSDPTLTATPSPLTINDSGTGNTFTVEGSNLGGDNVGLTQSGSYFTPSLSASTGWATDGGTYWYFTPNNGSLNGEVAMNYTGRELSASETVTLANNKASTTVTVNYRADVYILGNYGSSGWDYSNGILMTYDATNNTYTASVTADVGDLIVFARKLGESNPWNSRILFGPNSNGDWWVNSSPNPKEGTIDLNDDDPIYFNCAGNFTIEINATTGVLTVTREVVNTGDFELVTAASQLNAGDEVIIVNSGSAGSAKAMSTTQNSNNRGATDVTVSNSLKVTATESTQIFTLEATTGGWYFKTVNGTTQGYIYAASSSGNQLKTEATPDANGNAKAAIDIISGNVADIVFQGTNSRNVLQYNTGNDIFSCYGSASQEDVYLYRRTASTEPSITVNPSSLELVIPAGGSFQSGTVTVTETNTTGTTSVNISGTGANYFTATLENGTLTVTYNGTATQANPDEATITLTNGTATATVTVTGYKRVQASGTLYTKVTSADQIQDGLQYILVYEDTPEALNGITSGGTGATVAWETQGSVVNISNTDVIEFTLNGNASGFTLSSNHGYLNPATAPNLTFGTSGETWSAESNDGGYVISTDGYMLRYNTGASVANGRFRIYNNGTGRPVYLYVQGESAGVAAPVITPASGAYPEDQEVTITCGTAGATIYYTVNGGETQTYSEPFTVELDEENTEATVVAWAVKDDLTSEQVTVTYTYKSDHVNNIAEFLALDEGDEVYFSNPVIVLFDYSQNSGSGQEYIWVKDRTGYTQFFIAPQFDATSLGGANQFVPKYENGDVIPAGFKVKKNWFSTGEYYQGQCYDWHSTFQDATDKALADPEQVLLSELIDNPDDYNNRYLFINKLKVTGFIDQYGDHGKWEFYVAADENDDNVAEVSNSSIVGYNKYNSPAWKNKQGQEIGVTVPTDGEYYNVKFIFQKYSSKYELMPIEFTPWEDNSLRLEDLVVEGEENHQYTISNPLIAARVTWDDNYGKFAIFAKDDEMYANKRYPTDSQEEYLIEYVSQDLTFTNTVEQRDYDQSNWIEILIPSNITSKQDGSYQTTLEAFKSQYQNKILNGRAISGTYVDALNPTIEMTTAPAEGAVSEYSPNIYCTGNFLAENIDADGALSYRDDEIGGDYYFFMDAKPQEFCLVVWAYFIGDDDYFVAPAQEGNTVNGHKFRGSFKADMSLCEDVGVTKERTVAECFDPSNSFGAQQKLYGFDAIVRKNPQAWTGGGSNGAPKRITPYTDGKETTPLYIVYPLNSGDNTNNSVTAVKEMTVAKEVVSVRYYNIMGLESQQPFEGVNIVVTRYSDGSMSAVKVLK